MESSLLQAETLRNSTRQVHITNDQKVTEIRNISATVESQFKNLQTTGIQTLALVNTTISQVNDSLMCFADTNRIVANATLIARSAQNLSTNAIKVSFCFLPFEEFISEFEIYELRIFCSYQKEMKGLSELIRLYSKTLCFGTFCQILK